MKVHQTLRTSPTLSLPSLPAIPRLSPSQVLTNASRQLHREAELGQLKMWVSEHPEHGLLCPRFPHPRHLWGLEVFQRLNRHGEAGGVTLRHASGRQLGVARFTYAAGHCTASYKVRCRKLF